MCSENMVNYWEKLNLHYLLKQTLSTIFKMNEKINTTLFFTVNRVPESLDNKIITCASCRTASSLKSCSQRWYQHRPTSLNSQLCRVSAKSAKHSTHFFYTNVRGKSTLSPTYYFCSVAITLILLGRHCCLVFFVFCCCFFITKLASL